MARRRGRPEVESSPAQNLRSHVPARLPIRLKLQPSEWEKVKKIVNTAVKRTTKDPELSQLYRLMLTERLRWLLTGEAPIRPETIDLATPRPLTLPEDSGTSFNDVMGKRLLYRMKNRRNSALDLISEVATFVETMAFDENIFPNPGRESRGAYRVAYGTASAPNVVALLELLEHVRKVKRVIKEKTADGTRDMYCQCGCGKPLDPGRSRFANDLAAGTSCEKKYSAQIKRWREKAVRLRR